MPRSICRIVLPLAMAACLCADPRPAWASGPAPPADWFHIIRLDAQTFAISEPHYWQQNVSYLMLGTREALLFDTGPGIYSIKRVVASLTPLPVLVIPSHLHFDHVGRIQEFEHIALPDVPALRAQVKDGKFTEPPSQHMLETPTTFRVGRWIVDGTFIDLGARQLQLLSTPGHTPDSVTVIDAERRRAFTGDLFNRVVALYDVPGSDYRTAEASLRRILRLAPLGTLMYEAHSESPLQPSEVSAFADGLEAIAQGKGHEKSICLSGQPMLSYEISSFTAVLPASANEPLRPLKTSETTLDEQAGCPAAK